MQKDQSPLDRRYAIARVRQVTAMLFVYATFYVCRLAFSASKKGMIEQGAYTPTEIGYVGSAMLFAYAIGKIVNGFAQAPGAPCCVVALSRWWPRERRGTYYGGQAGNGERVTGEDVAGGQRIALTSVAVWLIALAGGFFAASRYAIIDWGMFFLQVKKGYSEGGAALGIAGMGNYIVAGLQSIISGYLINRAEDGSASLAGHTFANGWTLDYLAVFWIGMAALSVVCAIAAGRGTASAAGRDCSGARRR